MRSRPTPAYRRPLALTVLAVAFALVAAFAGVRGAEATVVLVDLETDYSPADEFAAARTRIAPESDLESGIFRTAAAFSFTDYVAGARIAEFDVPDGNYQVTVDLLDGDGELVARQQLLLVLSGTTHTTVVIERPSDGSVEKSAALWVDADGDGEPSGGDTLRYTVVAVGHGGESFVDELGAGLELVAGSVATTHGVVVEGNAPGDTRVVIGAMGTVGTATATIEFDAVVLPEVENQGEFRLEIGTYDPDGWAGGLRSLNMLTDDPATLPLGDPTRTPLSCDLASCEEDLDECTEDLGECETARAMCEDDLEACEDARRALEERVRELEEALAEVLADPDQDGVPAIADQCADSALGADVDSVGCTQAQFCGAIDLSMPQGNNVCRHADWRNDEPVGNPDDCRPSGGACVPY